IRSTGIGDALQRVLRLLGHRVITDNHIGDWGKQFGMLLFGWKRDLDREALQRDAIIELERIYKRVQAEIKQQIRDWVLKRDDSDVIEKRIANGEDEEKIFK